MCNCDMCKVICEIKDGKNPWFVKELESGYAIFGWNQHFFGYTLFICKQHVTEIFDLEPEFQEVYLKEMSLLAKAIKIAFNADKMNYECLGNGDVHLHWHLFPRKNGDLGGYGNNGKGPVWWLPKEIMWSKDNIPDDETLLKMKAKLLEAIKECGI